MKGLRGLGGGDREGKGGRWGEFGGKRGEGVHLSFVQSMEQAVKPLYNQWEDISHSTSPHPGGFLSLIVNNYSLIFYTLILHNDFCLNLINI